MRVLERVFFLKAIKSNLLTFIMQFQISRNIPERRFFFSFWKLEEYSTHREKSRLNITLDEKLLRMNYYM
jgi:hypothetical protein